MLCAVRNLRTLLPNFSMKMKLPSNLKFYHVIWVVVAVLTLFSVYNAYSLTGHIVKPLICVVVGWGIMYSFSRINYKKLNGLPLLVLVSAFVVLLMTVIFGTGGGGRSLGGIQTFYIVTFLFVFWLSSFVAKRVRNGRALSSNDVFTILLVFIIFIGLVALRNVSTAIILFLAGFSILIIAGVEFKHLAAFVGVLCVCALVYAKAGDLRHSSDSSTGSQMVDDEGKSRNRSGTMVNRITYFFTGESDVQGYGFQMTMSKTAVARSFVHPAGPGKGILKEKMPECENDFVFAMICEELSIFTGLIIAFLYLVLFNQCMLISRKAKGDFIRLLGVGIGVLIAGQAYIHIGVNVGVVIPTGQTLPFISRGVTNMWVTCAAVGILLNMAKKVDESADDGDEELALD